MPLRQSLIRQPLAGNLLQGSQEARQVGAVAMVEAECLFVHVARKVLRFGLDVGSANCPVKQVPEVFNAVGVNATIARMAVTRPTSLRQGWLNLKPVAETLRQ